VGDFRIVPVVLERVILLYGRFVVGEVHPLEAMPRCRSAAR